MKKRNLLLVILAVLLVFGMVIGCGPADETENGTKPGGGGTTTATFTVVADGSATDTTTELTLTFSSAITGLTAANITLSGSTGATKGELTGSGTTWYLEIDDVTAGGSLGVKITKTGISATVVNVTIFYYDEDEFYEEHVQDYIGVYKGNNQYNEEIRFGHNLFNIKDSTGDELNFTIKKWEIATTPTEYASTYSVALKFTGKIISAPHGANSSGYIPSTFTAPSFTMDDVNAQGNGPDVWMFLYIDSTSNPTKFVRSVFSSATHANGNGVVLNSTGGSARVFTKQAQ